MLRTTDLLQCFFFKSCFLSGDDVRGIFSCSIIIRLRPVLKGFVAYDLGLLPTHDIFHDYGKLSLCRRYAPARIILTQLRAYFSILHMASFTAVLRSDIYGQSSANRRTKKRFTFNLHCISI